MKPPCFFPVLHMALLSAAFCMVSSSSVVANLVPNGDFSRITDGHLSGWIVGETKPPAPVPISGGVPSGTGVTISLDEGENGEGTHSLKFESSGTGDDFGIAFSPRFPLLPGYEYEMAVRYRAQGLTRENVERTKYSAFKLDLFMESKEGRKGSARIITSVNSEGWSTLDMLTTHRSTFMVPPGTEWGVARPHINNLYRKAPVTVWVDHITVLPADPTLANRGFEAASGDGKAPEGWKSFGTAKVSWTKETVHGGQYSVAVSDAPDGLFSGWSRLIPTRPDRSYVFSGYVKGGILNPNGFIGGGALVLQFLDKDGQPVGDPHISKAVGADTDWTSVSTPPAQAPDGAVMARLTAGLNYTNGTAWFDDVSLSVDQVAARNMVRVKVRSLRPSDGVTYAQNLLANGDVETGKEGNPSGWTYVGKSESDWTEAELTELYTLGRPKFKIGRGRGQWSRDTVYSGKGALLNISIDPPLSQNHQWYGRNPVDGFWISDPMPCEPGQAYLASAWIRPGKPISSAWLGPLEIRFYNRDGKKLAPAVNMLSGMGNSPAGVWTYYTTLPYVAPEGAVTMRLRFGQEFAADKGGWGRTFADNLAVWKFPDGMALPDYQSITGNNAAFRAWFRKITDGIKPPYLSAPGEAPAYESIWGRLKNSVPGNLYYDPLSKTAVEFSLLNLLGEDREISLKVVRYDARGKASDPIRMDGIRMKGGEERLIQVELPPTGEYGAFYLDAEVIDGTAVVGQANGRYAVLPDAKLLAEEQTVEEQGSGIFDKLMAILKGGDDAGSSPGNETWNPFGVTPLVPIYGDGRPFEKEMAEMFRVAGFGVAWVRLHYDSTEKDLMEKLEPVKKVLAWYQDQGIHTVVQLSPRIIRPVDRATYENLGKMIGRELKGRTDAIGNWGIEQANSRSPYRGGGAARITDDEYDTMLAGQYDGIKVVAPEMTVLVGNIATDFEADTLKRLYGPPAEGKFDGFCMNAYMGALKVASNALKVMDAHGDTEQTVWWEEQSNQRSPYEGEARRYGEIGGANQMVRTWLTMLGKLGSRIKAVTMWGFVVRNSADIMMVTPELQPRPQYAAHVVMAGLIKDAVLKADHSQNDMSIFEWTQPGGRTVWAAWANAGERYLTLDVPDGKLAVMDIFGNRHEVQAVDGVVTLKLTTSPLYLISRRALAVSKRVEAALMHGGAGEAGPTVCLRVKNNDDREISGSIFWSGALEDDSPLPFQLERGKGMSVTRAVLAELPQGERSPFRAEIKTDSGAVYAASASMNFARAVRASSPPALDGTWDDWSHSSVITFGKDEGEVEKHRLPPDVEYRGTSDILGKLRLMWDEENLYLGVEALDDKHVAQPQRNGAGFMGDSIELGFQPDGLREIDAPHWEYELYLPDDGQKTPMVSRRFPHPAGPVEDWKTSVKLTGDRGNANYQAAIPWDEIGLKDPEAGRTFAMAVVLNDADRADRLSGKRKRILWFRGVDGKKNPMGFGDVTLAN